SLPAVWPHRRHADLYLTRYEGVAANQATGVRRTHRAQAGSLSRRRHQISVAIWHERNGRDGGSRAAPHRSRARSLPASGRLTLRATGGPVSIDPTSPASARTLGKKH